MGTIKYDIIEKLEKNDQDKVNYFLQLLLNQNKYKKLNEEISLRRKEIKKKDVLTHDEMWNLLDV